VTLRIHDSATQTVRDFVPLEAGKAGIYVCGLTVQSEPHVGHVRSAVNFDVLRRWLQANDYAVTFIRNITDIDDKILVKSAEQDRPWYNLAYDMKRELDRAYADLNVLPPTYEPAATGHVPEMIELIAELIDKGHAYVAGDDSGDVYFDVRSWPSYGELTHQAIDDMEAAEDADPRGKRDPRDFALWKGAKDSEPDTAKWPAPWGRGRPGWHIECSAMAGKYLGAAFDIHGGGVDLRFPHHENEQAQSKASGRAFASYWMHNAWITTAGEKMSKSLGNSLVVPEVLNRVRGVELRYYMVAAHYRSHVEFSFEALEEAAAAFQRVERFVSRFPDAVGELPEKFVAAMNDDLGTPAAVAVIHDLVRDGNTFVSARDDDAAAGIAGQVWAMLRVLGLDPADFSDDGNAGGEALDAAMRYVLKARAAARADKDWAKADQIRDEMSSVGVTIEDTPDGPKWSLD